MMPSAQMHRVPVSAGELAYLDQGDGPAVVLLHGFPTSSRLWRRETWLLGQRMRVIVPDLLGYGESEKPVGADLSERAQAGYVRELLERLGIDRVALVGHDVGGAVAQLLALDGGFDVGAMVLVDSACFDAWPIEGLRMIQATRPDQETAQFAGDLVRAALQIGVAHQDHLAPEVLEMFVAPWMADPGALFRAARGVTGEGLAARERELARLDVPTLVLWGEEDPFLPAELAERLGESLPDASVALLPGCSHFLTEDAPQTVGPLVSEYLRARYLEDRHEHGIRSDGPVLVSLERPATSVDHGPEEE